MNQPRHTHAIRAVLGVVALLGIAHAPLAAAQTTDAGLVVRAGTIYPAPDSAPIRDGIVVIRNGAIAAVGSRAEVTPPAGMPVLDLGGQTLVAGFWNSHVHFSGPQWKDADSAGPAPLGDALQQMLTRWGFTTVFDTGSPLKNTLALRRRIESGAIDGPRIFTTGDILFPPGADGDRLRVGTPAEARAAATMLLDGGADAVKVYAQAFWDLKLKLSPEVLAAVRAETRRRAVRMFAHPSNREGLDNAIDAGVDVLVHTTPQIGPWGAERVAKMKASNMALIPTLKLWRFELLKDKVPEAVIEQFQRRGIDQLREYFSAGGPILFGTDVGYMTDFSTLEEFQKMAESGMGFRDVLASLTTVPAARRGLASKSGRVGVGFDANLVALGTDPARTIDGFADVASTIRRGRVIYRASQTQGKTGQRGTSPVVAIRPYPGSVKLCSDHVIGAPRSDGSAGMNISWTSYYATDSAAQVVAHYTKALGSTNHEKDGDSDTWRFPPDTPVQVLTVTHPKGTFPRGQCSAPPGSARSIVIVSTASRPGNKP